MSSDINNLKELLGNKLTRNLGLNLEKINRFNIEHFDGMDRLIRIQLTIDGIESQIIGFKGENDILENFLDPNVIKLLSEYAKQNPKLEFVNDMGEFDQFEIKREDIDVTNIHALLKYKRENYHFKIYANLKNSKKEMVCGSQLSKVNLHPKLRGAFILDGIPFIIIWERIKDATNYDQFLGDLFVKLINDELDFDQFKLELSFHYDNLARVLNTFWSEINETTRMENDVSKAKSHWKSKLEYDYKIISEKYKNFNFDIKELRSWLDDTKFQFIHGDCWLRQFIHTPNHTYLLDLEDVDLGPLGYDVGSIFNSINQQCKYFESEFQQDVEFEIPPTILAEEMLETLKITLIQKNMNWNREVKFGKQLRAIHELSYLIRHQPDLTWLIEFIVKQLQCY